MSKQYDLAIIGGGAAGFFAACQLLEKNPKARIVILERGKDVLQKVKISGGGRCNVTHACWEPKELAKNYPRGQKELLGPFHKFCSGDMAYWLEQKGVETKIEDDGRMFPITDSSQTIVDVLYQNSMAKGVELITSCNITDLKLKKDFWSLTSTKGDISAKSVLVAAGSSKAVWQLMEDLNHEIVKPVPSLFTFNTKDIRLKDLAGLSVGKAMLKVGGVKLKSQGPLLVTHWGLSGPAILKLSAWGARDLAAMGYKFTLSINFTGKDFNEVKETLQDFKKENPRKTIGNINLFDIPKRLWKNLMPINLVSTPCASLSDKNIQEVTESLCAAEFRINGKSTFKDEFVTAGGIDLKDVDFRTMESKKQPNLYFAGEVLNIDAITGGFNFQAAWTTAFVASMYISKDL